MSLKCQGHLSKKEGKDQESIQSSTTPDLINSSLCTIEHIRFDHNPLFGSRDNVQKPYFAQNLDITKCQSDVENKVKVTTI